MTNAATGHAVYGRGIGWRKAVRYALTENLVTDVKHEPLPAFDLEVQDADNDGMMDFRGDVSVQPTLLDTDTVSFFLRGHPIRTVERYLAEYPQLSISVISYYEVVSGLKFKDARKQLDSFLQLAANNQAHKLQRPQEVRTLAANFCRSGTPESSHSKP